MRDPGFALSEKFVEAVGYLMAMPLKAAVSLPSEKKYHYPRRLLEQSGFITKDRTAGLNIAMLSNNHFVSPLMHLLNELRTDGHEVSAAWDEAIAMRDGILQANTALDSISIAALKACFKPSSTAGNQ